MLSQTAEYALRAVLFIAERDNGRPFRVIDISEQLRIPQNYLSKTMHLLARSDVLISTRGKSGGFRLARPADQISLAEIVRPFEQLDSQTPCLLGRATCSDAAPCAAHKRWKAVADGTKAFLRNTTVAEIITRPAL